MPRYAARVDANQAEIVDALRRVGADVIHLHAVGGGCPDLLVGFRGQNYLLEVKTPGGKRTSEQTRFFLTWPGQVCVVRSLEDALAAIGAQVT